MVERFRPSYGRASNRTASEVIGTANESVYLRDETGAAIPAWCVHNQSMT
jgi:hypothetical protein